MVETRDNSDAELAKYSSRVQAVVDVSGPIDFVGLGNAHGDGEMVRLFGGEYDKIPKVWRDASPAYDVQASDPPFLIVHGTDDNVVPIAQAQELHDKLKQAGVDVRFVIMQDGHTFQLPKPATNWRWRP
jgi:acetyl esterase/lipase